MTLSPEARALFDEAREASEHPDAGVPHEARRRMRANVLAAAAAGGATAAATAAKAATATATAGNAAKATATATAAKAALGTMSVGKAVLGVVAAAGLTFGGLTIYDQQTQAPEPPAASTAPGASPVETEQPTQDAAPAGDAVDETDDADDTNDEDEAAPTPPAERSVAPSPSAVPAETVEEQAALLMRARDAIRAGHHERAQRLLDSYRERYGQGALSEEQEALGVLNLCGRGDPRGAAAAQRFATRHPGSPLLQRIEQSCR